jgi:hypothetical protein
VQMIPGYRGFIKLARNSGQITELFAWPVYKDDTFDVNLADAIIVHKPSLTVDREPQNIVFVYAVAKYANGGGKQIDFMTRSEVDAVRKRSKAGNDGPWVTDYAEMARKTVVRRLAKYLPLSPELRTAMEHDEDLEDRQRRGEAIDTDFIDALADGTLPPQGQPAALPPGADTPGRKVSLRGNGRSQAQPAQVAATPAKPADPNEPPFGTPDQAQAVTQPNATAAAQRAARRAREQPGTDATHGAPPAAAGPAATAQPADPTKPAKAAQDWDEEAQVLWERIRAAGDRATLADVAADVVGFEHAGAPARLLPSLVDYLARRGAEIPVGT